MVHVTCAIIIDESKVLVNQRSEAMKLPLKWEFPGGKVDLNESADLKYLLDDYKVWIDKKTYPADEIAVRFKHRIVYIHCFSNGNGRHSRFMADLIIPNLFNAEAFSWGGNKLVKAGDERAVYLQAVKGQTKVVLHLFSNFQENKANTNTSLWNHLSQKPPGRT